MAVAFLKRELAAGPTSARVIYERGARVGLSDAPQTGQTGGQIGSKRLKTARGMQWLWYLPGMEPSPLDDCVSEGESRPDVSASEDDRSDEIRI